VSPEESVRLAADAAGDSRLREGAAHFQETSAVAVGDSEGRPAMRWFPPFLRWALWQSDAVGRTAALHMAANVYRSAAKRRLLRNRALVPIVASVVIGGSAVLLYGLALFAPVAEMLRGLAATR
jgi:hypothetical protein